jgi:hypothetical protein
VLRRRATQAHNTPRFRCVHKANAPYQEINSYMPLLGCTAKGTGYQLEVTSGWMVLGVDRTFAWSTTYRTRENGAVRTTESRGNGSYSLHGNALSLKPEDTSAALEGTLSNGTLAVRADVKLVYRKEDGT